MRREAGRPNIAGTLAGASLSFNPILTETPTPWGDDGQWSRETFNLKDFASTDLDLRISAAHARIGKVQLDDAGLSILLKNGRMELNLGEAKAYRGAVKGRVTLTGTNSLADLRGTFTAENIDAGAFLWDAFGREAVTGSGALSGTFETTGNSYFALAKNLDGRGQLTLVQGEVYGVDLDQALRRLERRPLSSSAQLHSGRTAFDEASAKFNIEKGAIEIENGAAVRGALKVSFSGHAMASERTIDLQVVALDSSASLKANADAPQVRFDLRGPWDAPVLTPDVGNLIRHSDAAAPLLLKMAPEQLTAH